MHAVARVTSKGQVAIPADVRAELGIEIGDELVFFRDLDGRPSFRVRRMVGGPITPIAVWAGAPRSIPDLDGARDAEIRRRRGPSGTSA